MSGGRAFLEGMAKNKNGEAHPNFPSGAWEGFYLYQSGPSANRHSMSFHLNFQEGKVTGSGADDVGPFSWEGTYNEGSMLVTLIKSYPSHQVLYEGMADTNGIYGTWQLSFVRGGFHIWPKKNKQKNEEEAIKEVKKELSAV